MAVDDRPWHQRRSGQVLPQDIDAWVDQRGRTRIGMVIKSLARRPGILPSLVTLWADSTAAMVAAARLIEKVIGDR